MALQTSSIALRPSDGWTLLATDPLSLVVRNRDGKPFQVAILASPGTPTDAQGVLFSSYSQSDGHIVQIDPAPSGVYYLRALVDGPMGETTKFGYLSDVVVVFGITVDTTAITVDTTLITCDAT
jgi:hypothetical protein